MACSLPAPCRVRGTGAQDPLTLPSAIPNLPEAAALTESVQALLLDQLKDLGLDLLPQLPGGDMHQREARVSGELLTERRAGVPPPPGLHLHNGWGLKVILAHPLGLAQSQNLRVAQATQFALELIQRAGLGGQSASDLLSDHLHNLKGEEEGGHFAPALTHGQAAMALPLPGVCSTAGTTAICRGNKSTHFLRQPSFTVI